VPIAHGEGCYFADDRTLAALEQNGRVLFRYVDAEGAVDRRGEPERLVNATSPGIVNEPATCSA
jgi:phosphoribosylformylglycinamidine synthase subunit PurQ / glutaminase